VKRTEEALGLREGYYRQRRYENRISMEVLLETLKFLGVAPADFFVQVFGPPTGEDLYEVVERQVEPEMIGDPVVREAMRKLEGQ
jgi:hypothetical protein